MLRTIDKTCTTPAQHRDADKATYQWIHPRRDVIVA